MIYDYVLTLPNKYYTINYFQRSKIKYKARCFLFCSFTIYHASKYYKEIYVNLLVYFERKYTIYIHNRYVNISTFCFFLSLVTNNVSILNVAKPVYSLQKKSFCENIWERKCVILIFQNKVKIKHVYGPWKRHNKGQWYFFSLLHIMRTYLLMMIPVVPDGRHVTLNIIKNK